MSDNQVAIKVTNLSKCYQIYSKPNDRLKQMFAGSRKQLYREFWALKDVSFEINKGETVGIVGRNGSGKSTLLQMICGILNPTSGNVEVTGRISALLELGSGFNPEFTGKENVYLNASILGLANDEIDQRYDDILAFAEIGDFIDQPVKTYSSGMLMRLAFSVAINVEPDILIVDEALSVGDELFQRKCFSRIERMAANGVTILFVSHSGAQIVNLCNRAILIDEGAVLSVKDPKYIINQYQKILYAPQDIKNELKSQLLGKASINNGFNVNAVTDHSDFFDPNFTPSSTVEYISRGANIYDVVIKNLNDESVNILLSGVTYKYTYKVLFNQDAENVRFGMLIKTISGVELGGGVSGISDDKALSFVKSKSIVNVEFTFVATLNAGTYFLNAGVTADLEGQELYLHRILDAVSFKINQGTNIYSTGLIDFQSEPSISLDVNS